MIRVQDILEKVILETVIIGRLDCNISAVAVWDVENGSFLWQAFLVFDLVVGEFAGAGQSMVAGILQGIHNPVGGDEPATQRRILLCAPSQRRAGYGTLVAEVSCHAWEESVLGHQWRRFLLV